MFINSRKVIFLVQINLETNILNVNMSLNFVHGDIYEKNYHHIDNNF